MIRINRKLNLVITIKEPPDDKGVEQIALCIHSRPLSREVFEANYLLMATTWSAMFSEGINASSAPRVASLVLRDVAKRTGREVECTALLGEIHRFSMAIVPDGPAWKTLPLTALIGRELIGPDELAAAEGLIVFFMLASALAETKHLSGFLTSLNGLFGTQTVSSDCTGFLNSLPISKPDASFGASAAASSAMLSIT